MSDRIPSFHDGYVTGLLFDKKRVTLLLTRVSGEAAELTLQSVEVFHACDVRQGNIILDIEVIRNEKPAPHVMKRLFGPPHPSAEQRHHDAYEKVVAAKSAAVEAGSAIVVLVTPSYGADIAAFCASATLKWLSK